MRAIYSRFILITAIVFAGFAMVAAQEVPENAPNQEPRMRPNLLQELGLTPEQQQAIKAYNQENGPALREALRRVRETNRDLDQAIYGDKVEDAVVEEKLKAFQDAQAEAARLRFNSELALRKLLTPEQLQRFRELRRRFAETRQQMQKRRQDMPQRPFRQLNRPNDQRKPTI